MASVTAGVREMSHWVVPPTASNADNSTSLCDVTNGEVTESLNALPRRTALSADLSAHRSQQGAFISRRCPFAGLDWQHADSRPLLPTPQPHVEYACRPKNKPNVATSMIGDLFIFSPLPSVCRSHQSFRAFRARMIFQTPTAHSNPDAPATHRPPPSSRPR